jgi:hypothetical protein
MHVWHNADSLVQKSQQEVQEFHSSKQHILNHLHFPCSHCHILSALMAVIWIVHLVSPPGFRCQYTTAGFSSSVIASLYT